MQSDIIDALRGLLDHVDRNTCTHESTHRGGFIWTICDDCGAQWADDKGGFKPHEDAPAVAKARSALTAALSDKQAGEVKIKPLEWRAEPPYHVARVFGNVYAVEAWDGGVTLSGIGGRRDFKTISEAKAAAQADYEQRIRSALVDVPAVEPAKWPNRCNESAVEALRYLSDHDRPIGGEQTFNRAHLLQIADEIERMASRPLSTSPPLPREGEDSEKVERLTRPIVGIEHRTAQEVFDIMADRIRLAATRSGSATGQSGEQS